MDYVRASRPAAHPPRASAPRVEALALIRRLDPGSVSPGPWASDEEIGERLLRLGRSQSRRLLPLLVSLLRPSVERAVRDVLEREIFLLDVAEVSVRVFALFARRALAVREEGEPGPLPARLRALALDAARQGLYPDPLEPPFFREESLHDPVLVRAAQAAFNRLPRTERLALRFLATGARSVADLAVALGTRVEVARRVVARARRRFASEQRRLLAGVARRRRAAGPPRTEDLR